MNRKKKMTVLVFVVSAVMIGFSKSKNPFSPLLEKDIFKDRSPASVSIDKKTKQLQSTAKALPEADNYRELGECWSTMEKQIAQKCDPSCARKSLSDKSSYIKNLLQDGWLQGGKKKYSPVQNTDVGRFYYALGRAGLLFGNEKVVVDESDGLRLLTELSQNESSNAAPALFKAALEFRLKKFDVAKATLERMNNECEYFDSKIAFANNQITKAGLDNVYDFFEAVSMRSSLPMPDFQAVREMQRGLNVDLEHVGLLMVNTAEELSGRMMELRWIPLEYQTGFLFVNPDRNNPRHQLHTMQEYMHQNTWVWNVFDISAECSEDGLKKILSDYKEQLEQDAL